MPTFILNLLYCSYLTRFKSFVNYYWFIMNKASSPLPSQFLLIKSFLHCQTCCIYLLLCCPKPHIILVSLLPLNIFSAHHQIFFPIFLSHFLVHCNCCNYNYIYIYNNYICCNFLIKDLWEQWRVDSLHVDTICYFQIWGTAWMFVIFIPHMLFPRLSSWYCSAIFWYWSLPWRYLMQDIFLPF